MKKKLTAILIALIIAISLLPISAVAVSASKEDAIMSAVEKVVTDYAESVYQTDADDQAFSDYFRHGFFGNGKKMVLNENSAMVSALFNACVLQDAVIRGVTRAITDMQTLQEPVLLLHGGPGWHNYYYTYQFTAYRGDDSESGYSLGQILQAKDIYGENRYGGATNENDEVMELLVGYLHCDIVIRQAEQKEDTAVYNLEFHIWDDFNFSGDYSKIAEKGYDTSTDDTLNNLGYLLTFVGLDEFNWEYKKTLTVEVPTSCEHSGGAIYHWSYDTNSGLISHENEGFQKNDGVPMKVVIDDQLHYQYRLNETVVLHHDKPWVVEYEMSPIKRLSLSALPASNTCYPYFLQHDLTHLWIPYYETVKREDKKSGYRWHYMGVEMGKQVQSSSAKPYFFRVENIIGDDGSNMPWVTVYDQEDNILFGPEALNDYWTSSDLDTTRTLTETDTNRLVGTDIIINYIGSRSNPIRQDSLELWIWENGKDEFESQGTYRAPTCTKQGGYVHQCHKCTAEYITNAEAALGHSYGEYVLDNNAGCTTDGTKTRTCFRCGDKDTVNVPDTATGHIYNAVVTPPTYTEQGYTTYTCSVCGDSYKDDYTDVKEHEYEAVVTAPTCTEQGYTTYTCKGCGDSYVADYTELAEHTPVIDPYVPPTCVSKGLMEGSHCGVCGYVIKKQAAISMVNTHRMEESIVKMPTYDEPGEVAYICRDCGKTDTMEIPPLEKPALVNPFTDVAESDWFYEPVLWAVEEGVTGGKTATTFSPNEGCTRGQVVTFLWAANGKPEPISMENKFTDVSESDWYYNAVLWAVEQGITTGVTATEFGPEQVCTRAQIATFLWAAEGKHAVNGKSEFTDVADGEWYAAPIIWAKENDISGGIGDDKFGPNDTCTRAQVVTFLKKVYG